MTSFQFNIYHHLLLVDAIYKGCFCLWVQLNVQWEWSFCSKQHISQHEGKWITRLRATLWRNLSCCFHRWWQILSCSSISSYTVQTFWFTWVDTACCVCFRFNPSNILRINVQRYFLQRQQDSEINCFFNLMSSSKSYRITCHLQGGKCMSFDFKCLILCLNLPRSSQSASLALHAPKLTPNGKKMTMQFTPNHPCQICLLSTEVKEERRKEIRLRTVKQQSRESASETWHTKKSLSTWAQSLCLPQY